MIKARPGRINALIPEDDIVTLGKSFCCCSPGLIRVDWIETRLRERFRSMRKDCVLVQLHTDEDMVHLRRQVRERALVLSYP